MFFIIDSDVILANRICANPQNTVSFEELKKLRAKIESKVRSVLVDISEESIFSAIEFHPELFKWNGKAVEKTDKQMNNEYFYACFNSKIPSEIRNQVLEIINTYKRRKCDRKPNPKKPIC
jgi:fructose-1-phosphate kinase PfkB-like protein